METEEAATMDEETVEGSAESIYRRAKMDRKNNGGRNGRYAARSRESQEEKKSLSSFL